LTAWRSTSDRSAPCSLVSVMDRRASWVCVLNASNDRCQRQDRDRHEEQRRQQRLDHNQSRAQRDGDDDDRHEDGNQRDRHQVEAIGVLHDRGVQRAQIALVEICARQEEDLLDQPDPQAGDGMGRRPESEELRPQAKSHAGGEQHEDRHPDQDHATGVAVGNRDVKGPAHEKRDRHEQQGLQNRDPEAGEHQPPGPVEEPGE
jgi:hypothetical protein